MTAEIAILNRQAVALAADSAVTVNYPDGQKIYNSVNKLFMLSKYAPVGIMVYGVADLTGVPWETIIKSFRKELREERFPHLQDYADRLIDYINNHKFMFTEADQERQFVSSVFSQFLSILRDIDQASERAIPPGGSISESRVRSIVTAKIREAHSRWTTADKLPGSPESHPERIRAKWRGQINTIMDYVFEKLPVTELSRKRLREIATLVFTANVFPDNVSGVVIAGFGEEDYAPDIIAYDMEGVLLNFVKVRETQKSAMTSGHDAAAIIPFAQREMVYQFMEGIDPVLEHMLQHMLENMLYELTDNMVQAGAMGRRKENEFREQMEKAAHGLDRKFFELLGTYRHQEHVLPIISAVANLPKEELASMAEALVNLTSFKRRVTHDPETVGGPIDVAVISKGDGFIWINRKHYFDPALNHHFFANYYRD